jgi:hypothetical protein
MASGQIARRSVVNAIAFAGVSSSKNSNRNEGTSPYTSLIATLRELKKLDEARSEAESLIQVHPDDSRVLFAAGRVFKELFARDHDAALLDRANSYYVRAAELQPEERNILNELRSLV